MNITNLIRPKTSVGRYGLVLVASSVLVVLEYFSGHEFGSASLLADMYHAITHVAGALLALGIIVIVSLKYLPSFYEELARIVGTFAIMGIMIFLSFQAVTGEMRFPPDEMVHTWRTIAIVVVAILINWYQHRVLSHDHGNGGHGHDILCTGLRTHIWADMLKNGVLILVPIIEWQSGYRLVDTYGAYAIMFIFMVSALYIMGTLGIHTFRVVRRFMID